MLKNLRKSTRPRAPDRFARPMRRTNERPFVSLIRPDFFVRLFTLQFQVCEISILQISRSLTHAMEASCNYCSYSRPPPSQDELLWILGFDFFAIFQLFQNAQQASTSRPHSCYHSIPRASLPGSNEMLFQTTTILQLNTHSFSHLINADQLPSKTRRRSFACPTELR